MVLGQVLTENGVSFYRVLEPNPQPGRITKYEVHKFYEQTLRRLEIRFRVNVEGTAASPKVVLEFGTGREYVSYVSAQVLIDTTNGAIVLKDATSGAQSSTAYSGGWIRAVMEYRYSTGGEARLEDDSGNALASVTLSPASGTETSQYMKFWSYYETDFKCFPDINYIVFSYDERPPMFEPSDLDPNDPAWAPADGWTEVHQFNSYDDMKTVSPFSYLVSIANGIICIAEGIGRLTSHYISVDGAIVKRTALALKFQRATFTASGETILRTELCVGGGTGVAFTLDSAVGERTATLIDEGNPDQPAAFSIPKDWFVLTVELLDSGGVVKAYDRDKNLILEYPLTPLTLPGEPTEPYLFVYLSAKNRVGTDSVWSTLVDWFAFKV